MSSIIDRPKYFTTLPREYYLDDDRFRTEVDQIISRQWRYAAHVSQIPSRGDYVTCEFEGLGESVLLVRGDDGAVNGFYNVCRHRGYSMCEPGTGSVKRLTCPYHRWTYNLDGKLVGAPSMPDGEEMNYSEWGLLPAHVEVWNGFIFVNLSRETPAPMSPALNEIAPEMYQLEGERLKIIAHTVVDLETNWKLLLENSLECYHCAGCHPELLVALDIGDILGDAASVDPTEYRIGRLPLKPGMKTISIDGEYVSTKLLGEFGRGVEPPEGFATGILIQPAVSMVLFQADYGVAVRHDPVSATRTKYHTWFFVREDAEEGVDYQIDKVTEVIGAVIQQDADIVEHQLRGVRSSRYVPGPLSRQKEPAVKAALSLYLNMMGEPSELDDLN